MNANDILFRCSALGHLMTEPKSKSEKISETTKKHLCDIYVSRVWGKSKETFTKFTNKGLMVEEDSLTLFSRHQRKFFTKNEVTLANPYIMGTPDVITSDMVIDIKSSWDAFTFIKTRFDLNKMYYWQLQGYMWLAQKEKAMLAYCLINTPDVIVQGEKRKLAWQSGIIDDSDADFQKALEEVERNHNFDNLTLSDRVHIVEIERNEQDIERLINRIKDARLWMQENLFKPEVEQVNMESSGHE